MIDIETIRKNFSRCAAYYDQYATVQNCCAQRLIDQIEPDNFPNILEIGCGTGNYTQLLSRRFPQAKIMAVDISLAMIEVARKKSYQDSIDFIVADAEKLNLEADFNLLCSNASLQWFNNLDMTLLKYKGLLAENGLIAFSLFGPETFFELNESLRQFSDQVNPTDSRGFINSQTVEEILGGLFKQVTVETKIYKERYNSLSQLLEKIKYTGARGHNGQKGIFWTAQMLNELERIYKERFKEIVASYEVFFCKGVK
ncbi:malonyl-ACP O-methyltransferase BioC [Candidatus Omnitrophota bacterium]